MRPLSLTVRAAEPGDRYDRLNEVSFRQEVARVIESLPALFDGRYLRLSESGTLRIRNPGDSPAESMIELSSPGGSPGFVIREGDGLGGELLRWNIFSADGTLRVQAEDAGVRTEGISVGPSGQVGLGTIAPRARLSVVGDGGPSIHVSDNGAATGVYSYARYISLDVNSPGVYPALIIPNSTAARVVVAMLDSSSGSRVGAWELWVSSSPTHCVNSREIKVEPNEIIGADVYWKAAGGTAEDVDKRTLILDTTKDGFTNQFLVHVEHYARETPIQWLL